MRTSVVAMSLMRTHLEMLLCAPFIGLSAWCHAHRGFGRVFCKKEIHAHFCFRSVNETLEIVII